MIRLSLFAIFTLTTAAPSQWKMQDAHTTADLRGIESLGGGVAWASGTNGTVLRTEDAGFVWRLCVVPPGAEKLDFRGVQAFDHKTAIVMSSGPGEQSRLYKTTDGCQTWKLVFTNPDKEGFWDALALDSHGAEGWLLGDPVNRKFALWKTTDRSDTWIRAESSTLTALPGEGAFAASNSSLITSDNGRVIFGTGGALVARISGSDSSGGGFQPHVTLLAAGTEGAGIFSLAFRNSSSNGVKASAHVVAVGGNYTKPDDSHGTAGWSDDDGRSLENAKTMPHGYRSSVAYDARSQAWITVGPNGTDISADDGRNWRALKPGPGDPVDADQHWNALSLPFVVGPKGRIATLRPDALKAR